MGNNISVIHFAPGVAKNPANPLKTVFHSNFESIISHCKKDHGSHKSKARYHYFDVTAPYKKSCTQKIKSVENMGLRVPKRLVQTERLRMFAAEEMRQRGVKCVIEGQEKDLNGSDQRSLAMDSKDTVPTRDVPLNVLESVKKTYKTLSGEAERKYHKNITGSLKSGAANTKSLMLLNQQMSHIEKHIKHNAKILYKYLGDVDVSNESNDLVGSLDAIYNKALRIVTDLGIKVIKSELKSLKTVGDLKKYIVKNGSAGSDVWQVAKALKDNFSGYVYSAVYNRGKNTANKDPDITVDTMDHEAGCLKKFDRNREEEKALDLIVERQLGKQFEKELMQDKQVGEGNIQRKIGRYSGNNYNVPGLYGSQNDGADGSRAIRCTHLLSKLPALVL